MIASVMAHLLNKKGGKFQRPAGTGGTLEGYRKGNNYRYTMEDGHRKDSIDTGIDTNNLYKVISDDLIQIDEFGNERLSFVDPTREFDTYDYFIDPQLTYHGEIHYVPHYEESYSAKDLLVAFYLAEMMNFKVVTYGMKNLVPLFSLISHECVLVNQESLYKDLPRLELDNNPILDERKIQEGIRGRDDETWMHEIMSYVGDRTHTNTFDYRIDLFSQRNSAQIQWDIDWNLLGLGITQKEILWPHLFFIYGDDLVGINRYPYYEMVIQASHHPSDDELTNFYKNRKVSILQSSYDTCQELFESELWEEGKTEWFEHKSALKGPGLELWLKENPGKTKEDHFLNFTSINLLKIPHFRENVISSTLSQNLKPLQSALTGGKFSGDSYLSMQMLASLTKNVRFNSYGGSSNFISGIPHLNSHTVISWDLMTLINRKFKRKANYAIFGDDPFISPIDAHPDWSVDSYREWANNENY